MNQEQLHSRADEIIEQLKNTVDFSTDMDTLFQNMMPFFDLNQLTIENWLIISFIICKINNKPIHKYNKIIRREYSFFGGLIDLNENYKNCLNKNIIRVDYDSLYPTIIYGWLNNSEDIICEQFDFKFLFNSIFEIYKSKKHSKISLMRGWINFCYGIITSYTLTNDINITNEILSILNNIRNEFQYNIIYFETDSIYFHNFGEIKDRFKVYNNKLKEKYKYLSYNIENIDYFYITARRKYIEIPKVEFVETKGIKII